MENNDHGNRNRQLGNYRSCQEHEPRNEEFGSETKRRVEAHEHSINELYKIARRPGGGSSAGDDLERKSAADYCTIRKNLTVPRDDGTTAAYQPSPSEIDEALSARRAWRSLDDGERGESRHNA